MDRMFVVKALKYRPADTDTPPVAVDDIGFSMVRLMQLSNGKATGVRANLEVADPSALNDLARYYAENTRIEWTFEIGGSGGSFSVVLRWTKFDRISGTMQVVRTAVLRDLIREAEGQSDPKDDPDDAPSAAPAGSPAPVQSTEADREPDPAAPTAPSSSPRSGDRSLVQDVSALWPRLFGEDDAPKADRSAS